MKYHGYELRKVLDADVDGGSYWIIYKILKVKKPVFQCIDGNYKIVSHIEKTELKRITSAWTLSNAKEFIDSGENWNVLC